MTIKKETLKKDAKVLAADTKAVAVEAAETAKAAVKETVKKAAAKKPVAKKIEEKVFIQFNQKEATPALLIERAKEAWIAAGGKKSEIKSVAVYLKPEESMVYYVINDSAGSFAF